MSKYVKKKLCACVCVCVGGGGGGGKLTKVQRENSIQST